MLYLAYNTERDLNIRALTPWNTIYSALCISFWFIIMHFLSQIYKVLLTKYMIYLTAAAIFTYPAPCTTMHVSFCLQHSLSNSAALFRESSSSVSSSCLLVIALPPNFTTRSTWRIKFAESMTD